MLVLAGGLLLAQLLSAAINLAERDSSAVNAGGMQQAQRIADVVKLLDSLGPAERERIVSVLHVPPLVLSLDDAPAAEASMRRDGPRAAMFAALLRASLGDDRALRVEPVGLSTRRQGPRGPRHPYGRRSRPHGRRADGRPRRMGRGPGRRSGPAHTGAIA